MKALLIGLIMSNIFSAPFAQTETWVWSTETRVETQVYWVNPANNDLYLIADEVHERR